VYTLSDCVLPISAMDRLQATDREGVKRALQRGRNLQNTKELEENYQVSEFRAVHRLVHFYIKTS
jgi:hypothetical protein